MKTTRRQVIHEVPWGMLVWQCPDGEILGNEDGFMHVFLSEARPDLLEAATEALAAEAKAYGHPDGKAVFWQGKRPITNDELEMQLERAKQGLVPDPFDIGAINDEMRRLKNG